MLAFSARILLMMLLLTASLGRPVHAEPPASIDTPPIRHEIAGTGSGGLEGLLKKNKVPANIREMVLRGFKLDPGFPAKLPKGSQFRLVYDEIRNSLEEEEPRLVLRSIWVMADGRLFDLYRYSWREHPILKTKKFHVGLDLAAPPGTPVRAAADGVVGMAGWNGNYGNYVRIDHGGNISTGYAHLSAIVTTLTPGSYVRQGDMIGFVGMTGLATGPHLCFQLIEGKKQINPLTARPMIEESPLDQLVSDPGRGLPIATIGDLQ